MGWLRRLRFSALLCVVSAFALAARPELKLAGPSTGVKRWTLPLAFERNEGQMPAGIRFLGRTQQYTVAVSTESLRFFLAEARNEAPVELSFVRGHAEALTGLVEAGFRTNSYLGEVPSRYRLGVRNYSRIGLRRVYPGIDVEFYAAGERLEHDFLVAPGADASAIALNLRSEREAKMDARGDVLVGMDAGELRLEKPVAYQIAAEGRREAVAVEFLLERPKVGGQSLRFRLGEYDRTRALVIDPVIVYASFAAGTAGSTATAIATDPAGNVYLAGTTSSSAFNTTPVPTMNCGLSPCAQDVFVAKVAAGSNGAALQWITYLGAESGTSTAAVAAMVANGSTVYLGGSTNDTGLAAGTSAAAPNATGGYVGFISSLATATGALNTTALLYLDATPNNSAVRALALDGANNLFAAGALGSTTLPAAQLLTPSANALAVTPANTTYMATAQPQPGNAFVAEFLTAGPLGAPGTYLATPSFFTYVQTNTQINGIGVDGVGAIYVGGQTTGGFSLTEGAGPAVNVNGQNDAFELTFTPQPAPPLTIQAFTWIDGMGSDTVAGLALAGGGQSYLFGNTTSTNLPATVGVVQDVAVDGAGNGFVALVGSTGTSGVAPVALTYLGGSGTVDTVTGGAFANGNVYVTGRTDAPAATTVSPAATALAGVATTVASASAPFNTQALAYGMDATSGTVARGYLASLAGNLTRVNYVANVGGAGGGDLAAGVALDGQQNAYVAGTVGFGSTPYTSFGAYQAVSPSTANASAYVAEVAYAPAATGLTLTAATGSPSANPLGYAGVGNASNVMYTWTLTAPTATGAANLAVQIPAVPQLTYVTVNVTDSGTGSAVGTCSVGTGGVSCVVATVPQTGGVNDSLSVVVNATVTSSAAMMYGAFSVVASASSPASEYVTSSQSDTIAAPAVLTITPASTFAAATVFSTNTGVSGPMTRATYAFTIANTGAGASAQTSFALNLPSGLQVVTPVSVTLNGVVGTPTCDTSSAATGCTAINLPAGASLVYTLTATYLDAVVGATGTTLAGSFSAMVSGFLSTISPTIASNTAVERGVHLHVTSTVSAPPSPQTNFNLSDSLTYTIDVVNAGPSASSGTDPLTVTLPSGFVPTAGTGGTALSCVPPYTTCTVTTPVLAAGGSTTYTVTGSFPDTAANQAVLAAAQARSFSAAIPLPLVNSYESGGAAADYSSTSTISVQRTAVLTVTASSLMPPASVCAGHSVACVYMQNVGDTQDKVPYSFVVQNAGPNTAVNARVTIALPYVPANPAGTVHPLNPGVLTQVVPAPGFGTGLTCSYAAGTNQIVCTGGNLPVTSGPGTALSISGNGTIDNAAVPTTTAYVTTAAAPGSVTVLEDANGAPGPVTLTTLELDRAAHLVTAKQVVASGTTAASPINLDENAPSAAAGVNDTLTVTVQVGNTPLNTAPGVTVTETLPAYFRLTQPPQASANCTTGNPAAALPVNFTTGGTPVVMSCAIGTVVAGNATPSNGGTASVGSAPVSFSYSGKFVDNGINADITGTISAKVKQLTVTLPVAMAATAVAVDPLAPSDATSGAPSINVVRAAHLVLRKTRNASVAAAPSNFVDGTDPNLDEKTTGTAFGVNDEVEYDVAVGNAGVNTALGVQFTDTLPPYFTLVRVYLVSGASVTPDTGANAIPNGQLSAGSLVCYAGASVGTILTLPYATGGAAQQITCTYGSGANPLGLGKGASHTGAPDNATAIEWLYQGKFQDNAPDADDIGAGVSAFAVQSSAGEALAVASLAVDNGPSTDSMSIAVPAYTIQRAAHMSVVGTPLQVKTDETPLTAGGANGTGIIAQAELSSVGGTPVFNCLRYKVQIRNSGPNVARQPRLTLTAPSALNLTSSSNAVTTTPGSDGPLPSACAYGSSVGLAITGAAIVPVSERAGNTLVVAVDGYFKLDTLTPAAVNSQMGFAVSYSGLSDPGVKESAKNAPFAAIAGTPVTVVNTPSGTNFFVSPFSNPTSQPARLAFTSVATPGITSASISAAGPAMPMGSSPDPRNNHAVIPLYRTGAAPSFYGLGTTAVSTPGTNPTGICLTNGSVALADGFAKPERVLLWTLAGLPTGTSLNAVPNVTGPYSGDITAGVVPLGGGSYVEAGGPALPYTTFASLPRVQPQPAQVCGQVNGFASATAPMTVAVLEPINFAPLIPTTTQQVAQPPGKGVSEVAFVFPQQAHDYNDNDPCYISGSRTGTGTRGVCDDNLVLTSWFYGAEALIPSQGHVVGPLAPAATQAFLNPPTPYEVQAGATLFFLVADQVAVSVYNTSQDCDPGNAPGSYTPLTTVPACPISTSGLGGMPPQEVVFGSAEIAELTPSVNGGSSGFIALPPAAEAMSATTGVQTGYAPATATVTAGQTTGFQWALGGLVPATGGTYALSCFMVDNKTGVSSAVLTAGVKCQIAASIVYPANHTAGTTADPAIYVVTSGTANARGGSPSWKSGLGGAVAALLLPFLLARRKSGNALRRGVLLALLLLCGAIGFSGCGAGFNSTAVSTAAAAATYSFRASATPTGGGTTLFTAPFQVKVVSGN